MIDVYGDWLIPLESTQSHQDIKPAQSKKLNAPQENASLPIRHAPCTKTQVWLFVWWIYFSQVLQQVTGVPIWITTAASDTILTCWWMDLLVGEESLLENLSLFEHSWVLHQYNCGYVSKRSLQDSFGPEVSSTVFPCVLQ